MDIQTTPSGLIKFFITDARFNPVSGAVITISSDGEQDNILATLTTDINGNSESATLSTPPKEYSMEPQNNQPYSLYIAKIAASGYNDEIISGIQLMEGNNLLQSLTLTPTNENDNYNPIVIGAHTLWEYYPPKIAEAEVKPIIESGEIVLNRVVVPETIVVHDGVPTDTTATNYYVTYSDYIKNVASCEIYSTWPESTITANVLAIMSFTLNRVYTEWYRNKGYNFTITSSTAFDHKWIYGKAIPENISAIVDNLYDSYISRPGVKQPILTQYCDGKRVSCPNWMSQWGSKYLGDDGLSATDILRYYYGNEVYINEAEIISGIPASYPGESLTIGSSGESVLQIQEQLNQIANVYTQIPKISADGIYGNETANAVEAFQRIFNLPVDGIVGYRTWYKISQIYVAITKIAE